MVSPEQHGGTAMEFGIGIVGLILGILGTVGFFDMSARKRRHAASLKNSEFREEVLIAVNIIDEQNGAVLLKPRTLISERDLSYYFPNSVLVDRILKATETCCDGDTESQFIRLSDPDEHANMMKRVVNIASGTSQLGHIHRMMGRPVEIKDAYACITYAKYGEKDRIVRIDLIDKSDLRRFLNPDFVHMLTYLAEEGSHADAAAVFAFCAQKRFGNDGEPHGDSRDYVRRVSLPFPL